MATCKYRINNRRHADATDEKATYERLVRKICCIRIWYQDRYRFIDETCKHKAKEVYINKPQLLFGRSSVFVNSTRICPEGTLHGTDC